MLLNGIYGMNITRAMNIAGLRCLRVVISATLYYILYYDSCVSLMYGNH